MFARFPRSETRKSSLPVRAIFLPVLMLILVSVPSLVRAQNPNGALRGEVQDASAARVPHAQVIVESNTSSMTRKATADDRGEFRIDGLLPGSYRVTVTAKGFDLASANVDVAVSLVRDITVTLKPESGRETVNVQSNASSITTESIDTAVMRALVGSEGSTGIVPGTRYAMFAKLRDASGRVSRSRLPTTP